ncbi:MAG TPA: haloalkane dehalogenase [Actinomycetota bacterium]
MTVDVYRTPDERFAGLPGYAFEPHYVDLDGLRMHAVDEGPRDGPVVLLLHGEPTWSFLYRHMVPVLGAAGLRAVAPDDFGFGRSDKPTERAWYTYDRHCRSIAGFADRLGLSGMTVVVQDWGGPIGFRLAVERPDLVDRLVVLNTGIFSGRPPSEAWLRFRDFVRRVDLDLRPGRLVNLTCGNSLPEEVVAGYDAPHPVPESRVGVVMFPELVPTSADHPAARTMLEVRAGIKRWDRPALVLFSDGDPVFTTAAAEAMAARIPGAGPAEFVAGAGHFLQEQRGEAIAERVVRFVAETS